ncbi:MAG TPA: hypothetical protein VH394_19535 [Thermoanaerobaculia bacterium]|nr:hypothetical protein [Thermoanaerobaculia bacterium]
MRSVQPRHIKIKAEDPVEERLERNHKLAALIQEWQKDTSGHDRDFWPVLKAELERRDD